MDALEPRRLCAAGDPIESFGAAGVAVFDRSLRNAIPSQIVGLADGRTLVAIERQYDPRENYTGTARPIRSADFVRLNADGTPDASFGPNHQGDADSFMTSIVTVTPLSDGSFYALGTTVDTYRHAYVVRFHADGSIDATFGTNGSVELDLQAGTFGDAIAFARVYADGSAMVYLQGRQAVAAFRADGTLNTAYGVAGHVGLNHSRPGDAFNVSDVDFGIDHSCYLTGTRSNANRTHQVVRKLNAAGAIDTGFGSGGEVEIGRGFTPNVLSRVHDGWVVSAGHWNRIYASATLRLIKFDDAGRLDAGFGAGGIAEDDAVSSPTVTQIVEQGDGKLVTLDGYRHSLYYTARGSGQTLRFNADGSRDAGFGDLRLPGKSTTLLGVSADGAAVLVANESRVMELATGGTFAGPATVSHSGTLLVRGTARAETLRVNEVSNGTPGYVVTRDTWARLLPPAGVKRIVIDGGDGDDILTAPLTKRSVTINGGAGNDTLLAGNRLAGYPAGIYPADDVVLHGDAGDDTITFFGNRISAYGDSGNDHIIGNATRGGPSRIDGGTGDDVILTTGERGTMGFYLFGGAGNDTLTSGHCADFIDGGPGTDRLIGDRGEDTLRSGGA